MDAETGHITDPRRVLNRDEMPQFVNYASNKGNTKDKKAAGAGDVCHGVESENRDCETIDMTWKGLGGRCTMVFMLLSSAARSLRDS